MRKTVIASGAAALLSLAACATPTTTSNGDADAGAGLPEGPLTMIVAFDAGGSSDAQARLMAEALEEELGATITVENRPGAGGQIGYTALASADPDGSTFGLVSIPGILASALDETRGAEYSVDSFAPVALQVQDPTAFIVAPDSPYQSIDDLVAAAEANPGTIRTTTTGIGSQDHLALLELEQAADIDLQTVHFADGAAAAATAFLGGNNVDVLIGNVSDAAPLVENGTGRVLGVMAEERSPFLPDAPTFVEAGYDVEIATFRGYALPAETPAAVVDELDAAIGAVMEDPEFQQRMEDLGAAPVYEDTEEFTQTWQEQAETVEELLPLVREDN